eukprot:28601-Eustigmatos_ZCMA.PRE.1
MRLRFTWVGWRGWDIVPAGPGIHCGCVTRHWELFATAQLPTYEMLQSDANEQACTARSQCAPLTPRSSTEERKRPFSQRAQ